MDALIQTTIPGTDPAAGSAGTTAPVPLPRIRLRAAIPIDVVVFTSACPACGGESTWTEEREDTRMRLAIDCPACPPPATDGEPTTSEQPQLGRRVGPSGRLGV